MRDVARRLVCVLYVSLRVGVRASAPHDRMVAPASTSRHAACGSGASELRRVRTGLRRRGSRCRGGPHRCTSDARLAQRSATTMQHYNTCNMFSQTNMVSALTRRRPTTDSCSSAELCSYRAKYTLQRGRANIPYTAQSRHFASRPPPKPSSIRRRYVQRFTTRQYHVLSASIAAQTRWPAHHTAPQLRDAVPARAQPHVRPNRHCASRNGLLPP